VKKSAVLIHLAALFAIRLAGAQPVLTDGNMLGPLLGLSVDFTTLPAELDDGVHQLIENQGPDRIWDAAGLSYGDPSTATSYFTEPTPGMPKADDPRLLGANLVTVSGPETETWTYQKLDASGLFTLANVVLKDVDDDGRKDTLLTMFDPITTVYPYPLTMGTTWVDSTSQTLEFRDAPPVPVETIVATHTVDGWGTLVSPDGTVPALRIRTEAQITASGGQKSRRYTIRIITPVPEGLLENTTYASRIEITVDSLNAPLSFEYVSLSAHTPTSVEAVVSLSMNVEVLPNYPNPFASATTIPFRLDEAGRVRITVFDIIGRRVAKLIDRSLPAGTHELVWQAGRAPSGMYRVLLEHEASASSRMIVLEK
jgi:hypothetical protein